MPTNTAASMNAPRDVDCASSPSLKDKFLASVPRPAAKADLLQNLRMLVPGELACISVQSTDVAALKRQLYGEDFFLMSYTLHKEYSPFCLDFGPVSIKIVFRFCRALERTLAKCKQDKSIVLYHFEPSFASAANASFLLAAFLMLHYRHTPDEAARPFTGPDAPCRLRPFRDASYLPATHGLTLEDCLAGLSRATALGWFDLATFDLETYEALDDPLVGDIHQVALWIAQ